MRLMKCELSSLQRYHPMWYKYREKFTGQRQKTESCMEVRHASGCCANPSGQTIDEATSTAMGKESHRKQTLLPGRGKLAGMNFILVPEGFPIA